MAAEEPPEPPEPQRRKQAAIDRLTQAYRQRLERELDLSEATLDQIEEQAEKIGKATQQEVRDEIADASGTGHCGSRRPCVCGATARFVGLRRRRIVTTSGTLSVARACYHCRSCRTVFAPLDARLGLLPQSCSRRMMAIAVRFCSYLPFELAARELEYLCGTRFAASTLARYCRHTGTNLKADWGEKERLLWAREMPPPSQSPPSHRPRQLQGSMDGAIIFVDGEWREAKLGVVYEPKAERIERARYYATLENSAAFGRKMRTLAVRGGADRCHRIGMVADGGAWIWQEVGKYFPQSVQVLDYYHATQHLYHATQHLWEAAHAQFGEGTEAAKAWMRRQKEALLGDRVAEAIREVAQWRPRPLLQQDLQRKLLAYLRTHVGRMRYATFRQAGWHIGSGVVESGCKCVIKGRMGGAGMRWSGAGAEAMLHLCAHWRSYDGGDFLPYIN